jgi:hypothetical protein
VSEATPVAPDEPRPRLALAPAVGSVAIALGLLVGVWKIPHDWSAAHPLVRSHDARFDLPRVSIDLDPRVIAAAEQVIPRDATYSILTGPGVKVSSPITMDGVTPQLPFWLLPRRVANRQGDAQWVISFGGDLGDRSQYRRIVHVADGIDIAEAQR